MYQELRSHFRSHTEGFGVNNQSNTDYSSMIGVGTDSIGCVKIMIGTLSMTMSVHLSSHDALAMADLLTEAVLEIQSESKMAHGNL
jgi:hypothetical protein